jgi:hypothetical protein
VGKAKRNNRHERSVAWWARRSRALAHPTILVPSLRGATATTCPPSLNLLRTSRSARNDEIRLHMRPSGASGKSLPQASPSGCPAPSRRNFCFSEMQISAMFRLVPPGTRGGSRVVTNARWDAVDAAASGAKRTSQGELQLKSCERSSGARTNGAGNFVVDNISRFVHKASNPVARTNAADGKAVWSWHPLLVSSR